MNKFITLCDVELTKEEAREVFRSLAAALIEAIDTEKYNVVNSILFADNKFNDLAMQFNEDFETNQIKTFVENLSKDQ